MGCLQWRGRITKRGYLRSCGGGSGGGAGVRLRKGTTIVFPRKKGLEQEKKEKTVRVVGKNGGNTNLQWEGDTVGNLRKKMREKRVQEKERNEIDGHPWWLTGEKIGRCGDAGKVVVAVLNLLKGVKVQ